MAIVALTGLVGCPPKAEVADLKSGDTVTFVKANRGHEIVVGKDGKQATVRLIGLYTFANWPHEKTDIGEFARGAITFAEQEMSGKEVRIVHELETRDPRGRYLSFLEVGDVDFGQLALEKGHAAVYTEYPFSREAKYFAAEKTPRETNVGVWGGASAAKRLEGLRQTWASVRLRERDSKVDDPLLKN